MERTERVSLRVSKEEKEMLQKLADHYHLSQASLICMLIAKEIEKIRKEEKTK